MKMEPSVSARYRHDVSHGDGRWAVVDLAQKSSGAQVSGGLIFGLGVQIINYRLIKQKNQKLSGGRHNVGPPLEVGRWR
jgi:hypothetical protein